MATTEFLRQHGTKLSQLPASAIVSTAAADLRVKQAAGRKASAQKFGFAWPHVARANSPWELIGLALNEPDVGARANNVHTRIIYSDAVLLREALRLARPL